MKLEILLAMLWNLKILGSAVLAVYMVVLLVVHLNRWMECSGPFDAAKFKKLLIVPAVLSFFCLIPSVGDIWRVRISLIKLELASHENLNASMETIERIGKKLECKYLGCEESKK